MHLFFFLLAATASQLPLCVFSQRDSVWDHFHSPHSRLKLVFHLQSDLTLRESLCFAFVAAQWSSLAGGVSRSVTAAAVWFQRNQQRVHEAAFPNVAAAAVLNSCVQPRMECCILLLAHSGYSLAERYFRWFKTLLYIVCSLAACCKNAYFWRDSCPAINVQLHNRNLGFNVCFAALKYYE